MKGADIRETSQPPFGRYSTREVSHLTGVPPRRIGQWARRQCIVRSHESAKHPYSYQDVAETLMVRKLVEAGVRLADVSRAVTRLREEYGNWPLRDAPLQMDEYRRILLDTDGHLWDFTSGIPGEGVFTPTSSGLRAIGSALADGGWASVEESLTRIAVDPAVMSGTPTIRDRRITAMFVGNMAETSSGREILKTDYELSKEDIDEGRRWRAKALQYAAA